VWWTAANSIRSSSTAITGTVVTAATSRGWPQDDANDVGRWFAPSGDHWSRRPQLGVRGLIGLTGALRSGEITASATEPRLAEAGVTAASRAAHRDARLFDLVTGHESTFYFRSEMQFHRLHCVRTYNFALGDIYGQGWPQPSVDLKA
jgi:hypothetical protein